MARLIFFSALATSFSCQDSENEPTTENSGEFRFLENVTIKLVLKDRGAELVSTSDVYSRALSKFDIQAKTQDQSLDSEQDYLDRAKGEVLDWESSEIQILQQEISSIESKIEALGLNLNLPEEIEIVKTTMNEEGGAAGYTRGHYIVLNGTGENLITHELFHVLSRNNPELRDKMYATLQFSKCNEIEYPATIKERKITNPDAPIINHYLNVTIDENQEEVVFIIYSSQDWTGGSFFNTLEKKLLLVEGEENDKHPKLIDGMPVIKDFSAATNLSDKIGRNTNYNIHPEEIMAEHFVMLVQGKTVPEPELIQALEALLK